MKIQALGILAKDNKVIDRLTCHPGDLVAIVCPARKASAHELQPAVSMLENWGYRVRLGESVGAEEHQFGGSDALRAADLHQQFSDPEVRAVFCARGGYGCGRLLPLLDPQVFRQNPKWLVGFSDVTALHAWMGIEEAGPSLHAPMPLLFDKTSQDALKRLKDLLEGRLDKVTAPSHSFNHMGTAQGILIGGNLSVLYSLRGTPWFPGDQGAILFLEDLDEYLYHVDRMMLNLSIGGVLDRIAGLIVGGMTDMKDNAIPFGQSAEVIIHQWMERTGLQMPVAFGFPAGHQVQNMPIILGTPVTLSVQDQYSELSYGHL
jgi:muramoyltetrapeptide carboxypeptidase